jgi:hypothetical protein
MRSFAQVYKILVRKLHDFGPNNWTSELRCRVPGFVPFHGNAYADFTYDDARGQLTREWFGPEKAALWQGRWPRYHIEVKSTRGVDEEPFHISRAQMITVRVGLCVFVCVLMMCRRRGSRNARKLARIFMSLCAYRALARRSLRIWSMRTRIARCFMDTCSMRMMYICSVTRRELQV